ncbi:MAG: hypothetical protein QOE31_1293 [Solirubrobacteraceae bacterium]|nr:hypothetical protein [Solirubrobacteraceae bacterium]
MLPHLSELHGAATHLAVVAVPAYALILLLRRAGRSHAALAAIEPWLLGSAVVGVLASGATGLLVWGDAQTTLRGHAFRVGNAHFWLGIALAVTVVVAAGGRWLTRGRASAAPMPLLLAGMVAVVLVAAQGYLGGRMTYDEGVGVFAGGQLAQSAGGAKRLEVALARGQSSAVAGRTAFQAGGLGCARCHGDLAQGGRAPALAGGIELRRFRRVHGDGLFPPAIVSDDDVRAVDAWLQSLPRIHGR